MISSIGRRTLMLSLVLSMIHSTSFATEKTLLVLDGNGDKMLPKNYRIMKTKDLNIIGSGQFTKKQLAHIQAQIQKPIYIVDLRQESHGFINGQPVSWYGPKNWDNLDKPENTIPFAERHLLDELKDKKHLGIKQILSKNKQKGEVVDTKTIDIRAVDIQNEKELADAFNMNYKRFFITDHASPSPIQIKQFENFVNALPKGSWIYIHCRAGVGRTTTFMTLIDIMKSDCNRSLDDILAHQIQLGGKNLKELPDSKAFKYDAAYKRLESIRAFYKSHHFRHPS